MCFSAQASFMATGVLSIIGLYCFKKAKPQEQPLALVPLLFAFQQAAEGIIWITFANNNYITITQLATYAFCFFAYFVWPIWIPFAALTIEANPARKKLLWPFLFLGSAVAGAFMFYIVKNGIDLEISCSHITYNINRPIFFIYINGISYCLATIAPFFIVSRKRILFLGAIALLSVVITAYAYYTYFTSVWCFFAAIMSIFIAWSL